MGGYEDWTHEYQEGINILFIIYNPVLIVFTNQIVHSGPSGSLGFDSNTLNLIIHGVGSILKMDKGKLRALIMNESKLTFGVCFSVPPLPSFTSLRRGRSPVAPLGGGELLAPGEGIGTGVSLEASED